VGWKGDSNHRKVGYGLIGNLSNPLQRKICTGVHNSLPSLNLQYNLAYEYKGFYLRCTNLVIWVQWMWKPGPGGFVPGPFFETKRREKGKCKGFYFWRTNSDLLVFLEIFLTMSTKNIDYFFNQKPNFMFPDILKK
jgi:hypothetical protein